MLWDIIILSCFLKFYSWEGEFMHIFFGVCHNIMDYSNLPGNLEYKHILYFISIRWLYLSFPLS